MESISVSRVSSGFSGFSNDTSAGEGADTSSVDGQTTLEKLAAEPTTTEALHGYDDAPLEQKSRRPTDEIIDQYQVGHEGTVLWSPKLGPLTSIPLSNLGSREMTITEGSLLDDLGSTNPLALKSFKEVAEQAYNEAEKQFPTVDDKGNPITSMDDSHNDAFRHTFWNATMTKNFGAEFAAGFATAHEGLEGNYADREAMDLFNNELGRSIAIENPDATTEELATLVTQAINDGKAVVIDRSGELVYSDQVEPGDTGKADDDPRDSDNVPPKVTTSGQ